MVDKYKIIQKSNISDAMNNISAFESLEYKNGRSQEEHLKKRNGHFE
jgi:hypothetical protein